MIKVILFDCDGPIVKREKYFSQRLMDLGIKLDVRKIQDFFQNEFLLCETGKADLKQELKGRIKDWGWEKSLEELLNFWFSEEAATDPRMLESIRNLRQRGIKCYLSTDNEKYRTEYLWKTVGLENVLDGVYSSCEVGFLKHDIDYWREVFQKLSIHQKSEILVWDDDQKVLDAAKEIGLSVELYTTFESYKQVMEQALI